MTDYLQQIETFENYYITLLICSNAVLYNSLFVYIKLLQNLSTFYTIFVQLQVFVPYFNYTNQHENK